MPTDDGRVLRAGDYEILSSRRSREQRGTRHGVSCLLWQSRVKRKGEEIERCAHLSLRTSAVRHPEDGSASVRAPSSPADSRAPRGIVLIYVDTIFIRTDR